MSTANADLKERVAYYLSLPYRIELIPDLEAGGYAASIPDPPGCLSQGDTAEEAVEMIRDAQRGWLAVALRHGDPIPEPRAPGEYSGKFNIRLPRQLHQALAAAAAVDGVGLDLFVATALATAVGQRALGAAKPGAPTREPVTVLPDTP